jgi:uncharacterized iron-regulated membrane protein
MNKRLLQLKWNWLFWHRWLGVFACIGILMWGLSGLSHPIMSRLQPKPVAFVAPQATFELVGAHPPKQILADHQMSTFSHLSLSRILDKTYLRVAVDNATPARYFDVMTGDELPNGDALNARAMALHFTGHSEEEIESATFITTFSDDYHAVNRLLPVWRIAFKQNGNLRAFIDTEQTRLSTLVNDRRFWLTRFFQLGHNWSFLSHVPTLQVGVTAFVLSLILLSALSGFYLFIKLSNTAKYRLEKLTLRRWHRSLGLVVSVTTLLFATSGLFHLIMSYQQERDAVHMPLTLAQASTLNDEVWQALSKQPLAKLDGLVQDNVPYWYVLPATGVNQMPVAQVAAMATETQHTEHQQHMHGDHDAAKTMPYMLRADKYGAEVPSDSVEAFASRQVLQVGRVSESAIQQVTWVTRFADEYGFIFKRLPVLKVQLEDADHTRYYIEPTTGAVAAKVRDVDGLEGLVFAYLHKWSIEGLNKDLRDVLVSLFALFNVVVALLGLVLFTRRYSSNSRRYS